MQPTNTLLAFAAASLVLVMLPGPNSLFILGAGISGGRRHAVAAAVGVELGTMVHVLAAALGLSAIVRSSALAFSTITYLGVAYLVYLGVRALRADPSGPGEQADAPRSALASMRNGAFVNILNPKVSLFFLAFLPQFVDTDRPAEPQILLLGTVFFAIALGIDLVYAVASGALGRWLTRRPTLLRHQQRAAGVIYLALAALAAAQGTRAPRST